VYPRTNWRYWVCRNMDPNRAKKTSVTAVLAAVNRGFEKKCTSSMGWSLCSSQATKAPSRAAATRKAPSVPPSVQPRPGASMMPHTSTTRPTMESRAPTRSSPRGDGSLDSGTNSRPPTRARRTMGMFTMKTEPHQKCWRSQPPLSGPRAMPMAEKPAHTAMARARSAGTVKTLLMMDRVAGMISAPPMPIRARVAIRLFGEWTRADATEPAPKINRPMLRPRRRPKRSPRLPAESSRPAKTRV
jgi:hypothetical protein